jgi:class 3 adenylate cyclase
VIYPEGSGEALRWISDAARSSGGQEYITANGSGRFDYRPLLPSISCPTLILHREHDQNHRIDEGRRLAAMIADARFVGLPGGSHHPMWAHSDYMPVLYEFLGAAGSAYRTGHRPSGTTTILFTDLVGHTEMMQQLGDAKGRAVLREHERITRETLTRHGGSEVKTMGDGFMASFPTATSAVECAVTLHRAIAAWSGNAPGTTSPFPLPIRVGLNAGEPIEEGGDLFGTSVIMAARVAAHAGPGDILLPEPVRHLLAGKGFAFIDCGTTALKGFDEPVRLFRVEWRT